MLLTDREWLRFVTFGLVVGSTLGALYTAALLALGNTLTGATAGAVAAGGVFAVIAHVSMRWMLDRQTTGAGADADDATPGVDGGEDGMEDSV